MIPGIFTLETIAPWGGPSATFVVDADGGLLQLTYPSGFVTGSALSHQSEHGFLTSQGWGDGINTNISIYAIDSDAVTVNYSITSGSFAGAEGILIRGA
jgi:hypothetical protein